MQTQLYNIAELLNARPRQTLDWNMLEEAMTKNSKKLINQPNKRKGFKIGQIPGESI